MQSRIRYTKASLPECLANVSDSLEEPYKTAFQKSAEIVKQNTGEASVQVFQKEMKACLDQVVLGKEEKDIVLEFAGKWGYEDAELLMGNMECYRERIQEICEELQSTAAQKSRLSVSLGTMSGILIVILLL